MLHLDGALADFNGEEVTNSMRLSKGATTRRRGGQGTPKGQGIRDGAYMPLGSMGEGVFLGQRTPKGLLLPPELNKVVAQ